MTIRELIKRYPDHEEELEERAAIMEYHGGMDRKDAEREAVNRIRDKYKLAEQLTIYDEEW